MKKAFALVSTAIFLGGCAVPVPIQVASWALDGLSYIVTQKTVTDHGISMVAQKDCALLRGITEGELCREWNDIGTLVANADVKEKGSLDISLDVQTGHKPVGVLAINLDQTRFPLRVNPDRSNPSADKNGVIAIPGSNSLGHEMVMPELDSAVNFLKQKTRQLLKSSPQKVRRLPVTATVEIPIVRVKATKPEQLTSTESKEPASGVYWVIGSFRSYGAALSLVEDYDQLMPEVLAAKRGVKSVYRVVVGPVPEGQERKIHRSAAEAGLRDLWAIRIKASEWFLTRKFKGPNLDRPSVPGEELARLPQ